MHGMNEVACESVLCMYLKFSIDRTVGTSTNQGKCFEPYHVLQRIHKKTILDTLIESVLGGLHADVQ